MSDKQLALESIQRLPDDASLEAIAERLEFLAGIRKGLEFLYPYMADKGKWPFAHDVMYWEQWPVAQPALVFGGLAFGQQDWLGTWKRLDHQPELLFALRNTNHADLIAQAADFEVTRKGSGRKTIADDALASVFGIEIDAPAESRPEAAKSRRKKRVSKR